ncbi:MAG: tRNA pseudouridine(38-40) synthase TruA [Myxococcaceae bacterium]|nr:tRNA pseudouridine(38-40) synthase TruA [Myxococcaceae bacterium]
MSRTPSRLVALWCWYHGGAFRGYQAQREGPTVQQTLWEAMAAAGFSRRPVASGRTDAGVHARMHVHSFRLVEDVPEEEVAARISAKLPPTVGVALSREAPAHFNAHWRTSAKEYRYRLLLDDDAAWSASAWQVRGVDAGLLHDTLSLAVGTHDFFAFHDKSSAVKARTIESAEVVPLRRGLIDVRLRGAGFGRYMVRYLVGGAVAVARGEWTRDAFAEALARGQSAPRPVVLERAPAAGLVLWNVEYAPAEDPFTAEERRASLNVPRAPPFYVD